MKFTRLLPKTWILLLAPLAVFVWNLLFAFTDAQHPPALEATKSETAAQRVVRVYEGLRGLDGKGLERASLTKLMLTVWIRDVDGWMHDRAIVYPKTFDQKDYTLKELNDYWNKTSVPRTSQEIDRFNGWLRDCLGQMRLTIGGEVIESIGPDPVLYSTESTPVGTPPGHTWTRLTFRNMEPSGVDEAKMKSLVQVYGSECTAPISLSFPFIDSNGKPQYVAMKTLVNEGPPGQMQRFSLPLRSRVMRGIAWAALTAVLLFLVNVATSTGVLRSPVPAGNALIPGWEKSPWSTSRVVFAWWLAICTGCYLFLWAMEGKMKVLSGSAPLLMGINGGTLLAATWVTNAKRRSGDQSETPEEDEPLILPPDAPITPSQGFLTDLIAEGGETEISKLQLVVWNAVLGVVFIWESLSDWAMPEFDQTLMMLLGISSTAYVGFKASSQGEGAGRA